MHLEVAPEPMDSLVTLSLRFRLIDVREDDECIQNPIVCDYHIPLSRFDVSELRTPQNAKLLVLCDKGIRSRAATEFLREKGWNNAYSLRGGLSELMCDETQATRSAAA
jgi:rhodanese-related sulfurtransferase